MKPVTMRRKVSVEPSRSDPIDAWLDLFVRLLRVRGSEASQIRDELEDHLRSRVHDLMIAGLAESDAVQRAVSELGETAQLAQRFTNARRGQKWRTAMQVSTITIAGSALALSVGVLLLGNTPAGHSMPGPNAQGAGDAIAEASTGEATPTLDTLAQPGPGARDHAPHDPMLRRYSVEDLIEAESPLHWSHSSDQLAETIRQLVYSDAWYANGGDQGEIIVAGNTMFVRANEDMHSGVVWVIESLREQLRDQRAAHEARIRELEQELGRHTQELPGVQSRLEMLELHTVRLRARIFPTRRGEGASVDEDEFEALATRYAELMEEITSLELQAQEHRALREAIQNELWEERFGIAHDRDQDDASPNRAG